MKKTEERAQQQTESLAEAAAWLARLEDPDFSREDHAQWLAWVETDPEHARAFDSIVSCSSRLDELSGRLRGLPFPAAAELRSDTYDAQAPISEYVYRESKRRQYMRGPWLWYGTAAAVALVSMTVHVLTGTSITPGDGHPYSYATAESQHETAQLEDGSTIQIGADSTVTVSFSRQQRTLILDKGEALFNVRKEADRPFVVVAGNGTITAVGTEFNVRRDSDRVVVTVTEGSVTVSQRDEPAVATGAAFAATSDGRRNKSATLGMGEQVTYDSEGLADVSATDPSIATSWKEGRLQYLREPMRFVVAGVNRYSSTDIVIADSEVGGLLFTGTVFDGQTEEWLEGLEKVLPIEVAYVGDNTILLKKAKNR